MKYDLTKHMEYYLSKAKDKAKTKELLEWYDTVDAYTLLRDYRGMSQISRHTLHSIDLGIIYEFVKFKINCIPTKEHNEALERLNAEGEDFK